MQPNEQSETLTQVLDRLEGLEKAATPGPWRVKQPWAGFSGIDAGTVTLYHTATAGCPNPEADHTATAELRNASPGLIALVRAQAAYVEELRLMWADDLESSETADEAEAKMDAALTAFLEGSR